MEISELVKRYNRYFVLNENKTLKDLEPYGFKPTYDKDTGELIKETLWCEGGLYGNRPVMEISNKLIYQDYNEENTTLMNPLRKFVMNFHNWWYGEYNKHSRRYEEVLDVEIQKIDNTYFNVLIDLLEDGVIKRQEHYYE